MSSVPSACGPTQDAGSATGPAPSDTALHWQALRPLSWSTFRFTLPLAWEVTAYRLRAEEGRLQWRAREAFMAQLDWRIMPAVPDLPRTLLAGAARAGTAPTSTATAPASTAREQASGLALTNFGPFLIGEAPDGSVHACTYQSETKLLIQWAFPFAEHVTRSCALGLLDSYAPNARPHRVYQLYGVGVRLPSTFAFLHARVQPADVTLHWVNDKGRHLVARRIGMDRAVLAQRSLARLAEDALRQERAGVNAIEHGPWMGHPGIQTRFVRRAERGLDALLTRPCEGEGRWWHDEREGRIYALTQWGPRSHEPLELADVWVPAPRAPTSIAKTRPARELP